MVYTYTSRRDVISLYFTPTIVPGGTGRNCKVFLDKELYNLFIVFLDYLRHLEWKMQRFII